MARPKRTDVNATVILDLLSEIENEAENISYFTKIINVSSTGLKLESPIEVPADRLMSMRVAIGEEDFRLVGTTKWCREEDETFTCGIEIDAAESSDIAKWESHLAD